MTSLLYGLVLAATGLLLLGSRLSIRGRWWLVALLFCANLLPYPWGAAGWLSGYFGELSLFSGLLALNSILYRLTSRRLLRISAQKKLAWTVLLVAPWFFPLSLGVTSLDPYALGFGDFRFSSALLLLGLYWWVAKDYVLCLMLVAAQLAWRVDLLAADNVWNYLLDPWLVFFLAGWLWRQRSTMRDAVPEQHNEPKKCPDNARVSI